MHAAVGCLPAAPHLIQPDDFADFALLAALVRIPAARMRVAPVRMARTRVAQMQMANLTKPEDFSSI
jgi:hypothetical protein